MLGLVVRRLLVAIPMLLITSVLIFGLVVLIPGDAAVTLAGGPDAPPGAVEEVREELQLDEPLPAQYLDWLGGVVRLDFGDSLYSHEPITDELAERLPVTLGLAALVFGLAVPVALLVGVAGGLRPGSLLDRALMVGSGAFLAVPPFWIALVLVTLFAVRLGWLPPFGYVELRADPGEWFRRMIMPAAALALGMAAVLARQVRGGLADVMQAPYIRTAWAKGGSTRQVVVGHALKGSAMPAVTVLGLQVGVVLGSSVIIERIFTIPGLGTYLLEAVNAQDLPVVQGVALVFVVIHVVTSLLVDIAYGWLNPKVRAA
ncbi:MAG TPA: ABC transporter permease [Acidimicrobiales bacterium]